MKNVTPGGHKYCMSQFYRRKFGIRKGCETDNRNEKWREEEDGNKLFPINLSLYDMYIS
jgi:hypothetical protein